MGNKRQHIVDLILFREAFPPEVEIPNFFLIRLGVEGEIENMRKSWKVL